MSVTPDPDARKPGARRQKLTLGALFCILPALSVGGGLAIAPLAALCGLIAAPWRTPRSVPWLSLLLLGLALWSALSIVWSPAPRPEQAVKNVAVVATGLLLAHAAWSLGVSERRFVRASILAGMLMLALLLGAEAMFDMAFNRAVQPDAATEMLERNPGRGVLVLEVFGFAALAAALALRPPRLRLALSTLLLIGMGVLSVQFNMDANAAVLVIGAAAFAFGVAAPRLAPMLAGGGLAAWMLAAPWAMFAARPLSEAWMLQLPPSWGMRLQIWTYASERIAERPWFGWGLDSSRSFDETQYLGDLPHAAISLHPHSVSLQVWLETGLFGALLAAAALAVAGVAAARACASDRLAAAAAAAGFATLGLAWNMSYGAWQEWLLALPFIMAAAVFALRRVTP